jgi:serine/threonine-protein kinase
MAEELPVLIASLSKEQAAFVEGAALRGGDIRIPLKWSPVEPGPHMLEIYLPTTPMPLQFLAEPLEVNAEGAEDQEVALRVYPWEDGAPASERVAPMPEIEVPEVPQDRFVGRAFARGRFEIISPLGEGSIGAVYKARHTGLGILVALKVLHEAFQHDREFGRRFHDEALALSHLDHPNLIHIQDFGQDPDESLLYISMAFVEGETLRGIQKKLPDKTFPLPRIVNLMAQACAGLGHAHDRGLIHRDVKPDNMMIVTREDDDGNTTELVKVLDFGFAVPPKVSGEVAQRLAGTPVYMSPEQCLGQELDGRSDLYAIGIMLFEMATGRVPFLARDAETIRKLHVRQPAPRVSQYVPDVDPRFDAIVAKALSKRREDRQANLTELRTELRALLTKPQPVAEKPPPSSRQVAPPPVPPPLVKKVVKPAAPQELPSWANTILSEKDFDKLAAKLVELGAKVPPLAAAGEVLKLRGVLAVLDKVAERAELDEGATEALRGVQAHFLDPTILTPIAAKLLAYDEADRDAASEIITRGAAPGVYALYNARTKVPADQNARIAFVTTMKAFGPTALAIVRAALEKITERALSGTLPAAIELAEDVLLSVPAALDDTTGRLVEQYAASSAPNLVRAAARALPRVWADRAAPTLMRLLEHEDDGVLTAALVGLREINMVDVRVVRKIGALVDRKRLRTPPLKQAAMAALGAAMPSAKPDAAAVAEGIR